MIDLIWVASIACFGAWLFVRIVECIVGKKGGGL